MESIISILESALAFVIVIGILVFVHEFGHFIMARLSGMRVNTFALGMGWRLFGWNKVSGFTFGPLPKDLDLDSNCDYRIAAFPIGGYCQIAGMVDESFDTGFEKTEPKEWEFRAKNPFKKALTISGGVLFNLLFAIFIFAIVIFNLGETTYKTTTIGTVAPNSIAQFCGFEAGDRIIAINDVAPSNWTQLVEMIAIGNLGNNLNIKLNRNGIDTNLFVNGKELLNKMTFELPLGLEPAGLKTIVMEVIPDGLANQNGIKIDDTLIAVNSEIVYSHSDLVEKLQANKNQNITISIKNNKGIIDKEFVLNDAGTIGVSISSVFTGDVEKIHYNIFQAIGKGTIRTFETFKIIVLSIKQIIVGNMSFKSAIGGPVIIAKQSATSAKQGVISFISFMAMLSISLVLINILPFPALDGGHLIIIIIEGITKKEIPVKAKIVVQQIGMACLLALMAYVIFNDILKLI